MPKRRLFLFLGCLLAFCGYLGVYSPSAHAADMMDDLLKKAALPFRIAWLATETPDPVLLMPVKGARVALMADTWQAWREGGRLHEGQDIFAPRGTEIYSATDGYITYIGEGAMGGNAMFVMGKGGRFYYYAHLHRYAKGLEVGDRVTPGTVIGYVGNTGNATTTPPHLHFGIYAQGSAIDPLPLLTDR